jgi:ferritin-like metal-binding protein YciE
MATVDSLQTHLIEELADLLDAEQQLTRALPRLARSATSKPLKEAFRKHLDETRVHIRRLDEAMRELGESPKSKACEGMRGLISEGEAVVNKTPAGAVRDAVLITGAQKVEHYEMASYGTARTYAQVLGETNVARLLEQTLDEEKAADLTLTEIAKRSVNEEAAEEWQAQDERSALTRAAEWAGTAAAGASRQVARGVRRAAASVGIAQERSGRTGGRTRGGASRKRASSGSRRRTSKKR